jgi:subtilisin family serine protease
MKFARARCLALWAPLLLMPMVGSASPATVALDPAAPRMIVQFASIPADAGLRLAGAGVTHAVFMPSVNAVAVAGPERAFRRIAGWRDIVGMHPDVSLRLYMEQAVHTTRADLVRVGVPPLKTPYTGTDLTVAVLDTGIDTTHPDLAGDKVVLNLDFGASSIFDPMQGDPTDLADWRPFVADPVVMPVGTDESFHGTLLAGTIAGTGAAARGADLRGVAPDARLVNLDLNGPAGAPVATTSALLAGIEWLLAHRNDAAFPGGIRVAVAGLGADCDLLCEIPVVREALGRAIDAGIIVVFPTGGAVDGDVTYPARYPEIIAARAGCKDQDTVSGMCGDDRTFGSAPQGSSIDLVAPGVFVWVPMPVQGKWPCQLNTQTPPCTPMWVPGEGNIEHEIHNRLWYDYFISHSLAAAHVAGVATLMLDANPALQQAGIESILQQTARDLGPTGVDDRSGHGMIDALAAVDAAEG